jgi:hypothetical protein
MGKYSFSHAAKNYHHLTFCCEKHYLELCASRTGIVNTTTMQQSPFNIKVFPH